MENILGVDRLKSSILKTIAILFIVALIVIELTVFKNQNNMFEKQREKEDVVLHQNIEYTFNNSKHQYTHLLNRSIRVKGIIQQLKNYDREKLYNIIRPKFEMLQKENPYLKTFHFIKKDGVSFLRVHEKDHYGDPIGKVRPMLNEALTTQKTVWGYETGIYHTAFRIIIPVFIESEFWGVLGVGIDPNYFIDKMAQINKNKGFLFINDENLELFSIESKHKIKNYKLQTSIDERSLNILDKLPKDYMFENSTLVEYENRVYQIYTQEIKDYFDNSYGYYLFVYDVSNILQTQSNTRITIVLIILFFVLLMYMTTRYIIVKFTKDVDSFYKSTINVIEKKESYLRAVEDNSPNIIVTTYDRKIITGNRRFLDFTGFASVLSFKEKYDCICDLFIKRSGFLTTEIDGVYWVDYILGNPQLIHKAIMLKDDKELIFNVTISKMQWQKGTRYVITFVDITDMEMIKDRYETAIYGTDDGIWDWNLATDEVYFSDKWKTMLGYEYDEIPNQLKSWNDRVHPDDLEKALSDISDNIEKRTDKYENIHRLRHKDGSWVWILDRGKTIYDDAGNPTRMVGFHTNITKQKELEVELNKLKKAIEQSPISIAITDKDGNLEYVNPWFSKVTGYSSAEVLGQNPRLLKSGYTTEQEYKKLWNEISHDHIWRGVFKNLRKDGSEFWERAIIIPIDDENGKIVNYLAIKQEITEEVYLKKEIAEQEEVMIAQSRNAAMGEMISMIAHQWRQPLSIISMGANNILADLELEMVDDMVLKDISQEIIDQTNQLSEIIDDFREFFKPIKTTSKLLVKDVLDDCIKILGKSLENHNIQLQLDITNTTKIVTYERELLHVFLNIINNAKDALVSNKINDGFIKITIDESDDYININILDNAGGIKQENLDKIFNPYFTTKEQQNGTGIGLYMVKTIVERHLNGKVKASNINGGANFEVKISKAK